MCELNKLKTPSRLRSLAIICTTATGLFSGYCLLNEDEQFYEKFLIPASHCLSPETAHRVAVAANKYRLIPKSPYQDPPSLKSKMWDLCLSNPIGMAAGYDKHGEAVVNLHDIGFGFVEIGSITPLPQPGNEKPRVFRLQHNEAIINRYGFNSEGHQAVLERVKQLKADNFNGVIGINLGKNKNSADPIQDYVTGIQLFGPVADYLVINISSPNTPGLRDWQNKDQLETLLTTLVRVRDDLSGRKPPLLLKLAPDLTDSQRREISKLVLQKKCRIDGLVISNTTIERGEELEGEYVTEAGGLSGLPLRDTSTRMIEEMRNLTKGEIPIIGVGGIFSGKDAYDKIKAGASLVQLYTSYVYHGPPRVTRIKKELDEALRFQDFKNSKATLAFVNNPLDATITDLKFSPFVIDIGKFEIQLLDLKKMKYGALNLNVCVDLEILEKKICELSSHKWSALKDLEKDDNRGVLAKSDLGSWLSISYGTALQNSLQGPHDMIMFNAWNSIPDAYDQLEKKIAFAVLSLFGSRTDGFNTVSDAVGGQSKSGRHARS